MKLAKELINANIEDELKWSYLDYSMSIIIGRAIPDVRDGLKPVHRRIIYAMYREGLQHGKKFSKCAGVVGEVLKKYHPHGDMAVYDALVRMAQNWNIRYPLIEGQGNFGSIDGDPPAAYRYTEARLEKIAEELLVDIDKNTVDFVPNFDETTVEPIVFPCRIPNLLINGSSGIAVGMATNIPPHNLCEVIDAIVLLIEEPETTVEELMKLMPGPDFPTGGIISGTEGILSAYRTGRGRIDLRGRAVIEKGKKGEREKIVITEIPYQINKSRLIENIAGLVKGKKIDGISEIRDESDREGIRIVIELKKDTDSGVILNNLYKLTSLQTSYGIIFLCIVDNQPKILPLKDILNLFIEHRKEVIKRRTIFEIEKAENKIHILEGLRIILDNLDETIEIIKSSEEPQDAKRRLIKRFNLTDIQAQSILDMRLHRLTRLERGKILDEYQELLMMMARLREILANEQLILSIILEELKEIKEKYGDKRKTTIVDTSPVISFEDLIMDEEMVVMVTHEGYIKRNSLTLYKTQRRGGKGKTGVIPKETDFVKKIYLASTHDYFLIFLSNGNLFWLKVHEIPETGRVSRGKPIVNLIEITGEEKVSSLLPVKSFDEDKYVIIATKKGMVKRCSLKVFSNPRSRGIIGTRLLKGDEVISTSIASENDHVLISTRKGKAIRFRVKELRVMGRVSIGVRGIRIKSDDEVISMEVTGEEERDMDILTVTENGYGKRTPISEYPVKGRGGMGVITIKTDMRNGNVVGILKVSDWDNVILITDRGTIIRTSVRDIRRSGRNTKGIRLIDLGDGEKVVSVAKSEEEREDDIISESHKRKFDEPEEGN